MNEVLQLIGMNDMGSFGWHGHSPSLAIMQAQARQAEELLAKALTTGTGIVTEGSTGGQSLRVQWLHDELENVAYSQSDAVAMKIVPKGKAWSTTLEYTVAEDYGNGGDGFIGETGSDGAYGVDYADDNYLRQLENVKYMAEGRFISLPAQEVQSIVDPTAQSRRAAENAMIAKANTAIYFGNAKRSAVQWNGIIAQLVDWVSRFPADQGILYDAGGQPLDKYMLEKIVTEINMVKYGRGNELLCSAVGFGDSNALLFPEARTGEGDGNRRMGTFKDEFLGPQGIIKLRPDPMLRPGSALKPLGYGAQGEARTTATVDVNSVNFAGNPFVAASGANGTQKVAAGAGNFWNNVSVNTDSGPFATIPALPSGDGNQDNRLGATTAYYAVAPIVKGREGAAYIYGAGAQASDTISGSPTGIAPAATEVVQLDIDPTQVTGIGSTYPRNTVQYRVYSYRGTTAPTRLSQFKFLCMAGTPTASNARIVDNGMYIPGSDNAFLLTTQKDGAKGWELLQLLPLMRRLGLAELPMGSPLVLLWFAVLILYRRRQNVWIRNIGRA